MRSTTAHVMNASSVLARPNKTSTPVNQDKEDASPWVCEKPLCSQSVMALKLQASDDGHDVGPGVLEASSAGDKLQGCAMRSPHRARTMSESDLAVGDLTLNDSSFDANRSILHHSGRRTPPRTYSYRIMPQKSVLSPRGDSTACVFQLSKPLTKEQTRAGYCILTFDEPLLPSDGCKENGICMADFVVHIKDTQADGENVAGSVTLKTLPKQLGIGQSSLQIGTLGVFALKDLPHPCFFGPFFGRSRPTVECCLAYKCCVKVLEEAYKDTPQENGNWMTFIKFTNDVKRTNLTAFIHEESIYYKTTTPIKKFQELVLNTTCDQHYASSSILLKTMFE
ncbi:uncharacterized protein LOC125030724 [Penaeus chinensis]|uniref:uncharacterized protein LOC125030724 n=1 Tax=Penaeus chinensis TaxID=139456 RepID=UPI001FB5BBE7|nr:uncharacterized protein LOC125030724 [Penaeus chinensis]